MCQTNSRLFGRKQRCIASTALWKALYIRGWSAGGPSGIPSSQGEGEREAYRIIFCHVIESFSYFLDCVGLFISLKTSNGSSVSSFLPRHPVAPGRVVSIPTAMNPSRTCLPSPGHCWMHWATRLDSQLQRFLWLLQFETSDLGFHNTL